MKNFSFASFFFSMSILALSFVACESGDKNKEQPVSDSKVDSLVLQHQQLQAGLDTAWNRMIADDNNKIFNMKRLLEEVSFTGEYDEELYQTLSEQVEQLKSERYDRQSMTNSNKIDIYDEATRMVMREVVTFARSNPKYERYPLMEELILDIEAADEQVLFYRLDYDSVAKEYNRFILKNREVLHSRDSSLQLQPAPLFELQE